VGWCLCRCCGGHARRRAGGRRLWYGNFHGASGLRLHVKGRISLKAQAEEVEHFPRNLPVVPYHGGKPYRPCVPAPGGCYTHCSHLQTMQGVVTYLQLLFPPMGSLCMTRMLTQLSLPY